MVLSLNRMDNQAKIQALMIYFQHWGVEEARQRRRHEGIISLMRKTYHLFFFNGIDDANEFGGSTHFCLLQEVALLQDWVQWSPNFWPNLINEFLSEMGGYHFYRSKTKSRQQTVSKNIGVPLWKLYKDDLSDNDLLSLDAIVAWR